MFLNPLWEGERGIRLLFELFGATCLSPQVTRGVLYTREEAEGKRLRNPCDTITEGIGLNRLTKNFECACIDGAFKGVTAQIREKRSASPFSRVH